MLKEMGERLAAERSTKLDQGRKKESVVYSAREGSRMGKNRTGFLLHGKGGKTLSGTKSGRRKQKDPHLQRNP